MECRVGVTPHSDRTTSAPTIQAMKERRLSTKEKMKHGRRIYMKRRFQMIAGASAASLLALTAPAQETPNAKAGGTEIAQERSTRAMRSERLGRAEKVSDLIGMEVKNNEGEKLGKV